MEPVIHFLPRTIWAVISGMVGFDVATHIDYGQLPMMARNDVGGTSSKNTMHWFQEIRSGHFAHFDYGTETNQAKYGQDTPLDYDLSTFPERLSKVPILLLVGQNDYLVAPNDFTYL
jgi:hypothetical protein